MTLMVWRGVIIEESLNGKSLLKLAKIVETEKSILENEAETGVLTFHKIEVPDKTKDAFLKMARTSIKDNFYIHICKSGVMIVIYRNKIFEFSKNEIEKINEAREYGASRGILREQLEFEVLIDDPWA